MNDEQQKVKEFWRQNQKFRKNKCKYNVFLAGYEGDLNDNGHSDNNIDDDNKKANYLDNND